MPQVNVPQQEGEITVNASGDIAVYPVKNGTVDVPDAQLARFLAVVDGAAVGGSNSDAKPAS